MVLDIAPINAAQ